jgi:hypothetical protein
MRPVSGAALREKLFCAVDAAAVDSAACMVDSAACLPPSSIPLESQMASAEHHGCREIGWRKSGWRQIGCP